MEGEAWFSAGCGGFGLMVHEGQGASDDLAAAGWS